MDVESMLWGKLAVNSVINSLTALFGVTNGQLREDRFDALVAGLVSDINTVAAVRRCFPPIRARL